MEVLLYLAGIAFMLIGLALSIGLHEVGHLVPAKRFGVRVGKYMIGFGPTLWSKRIGETLYGVKLLPLGGFISMSGMYPSAEGAAPARGAFRTLVQEARDANEETIDPDARDRTFATLPVWKRVVIMLGGPVMNLVLAIVIFTVLASGVGLQQATTTIAAVAECIVPAGSEQTECRPGDPPAPAAQAGIRPGDVVVQVDGNDVSTFSDVSAVVQATPAQPLPVTVERAGERVSLTLTPALVQRQVYDQAGLPVVDDTGAPVTHAVGYIGVSSQVSLVRQPLLTGPQMAVDNTVAVAKLIATLPARVWDVGVSTFTGTERDPNGPLSVVGVGRLAGEVAATDAPVLSRFAVLLSLLGSLNIALFVFNLIPLLPLDGGHIVVALWDGLRRAWAKLWRRPPPAPVDATRLVPVTIVAAALLIGVGALLIFADLFNPLDLLGG